MIDILQKAAFAAATIQLKYFRTTELDIYQKTDHKNIVTKADNASQEIIQTTIIEEMKKMGISENDIGFIGEENLLTDSRPHMFVIDPIDGTSNFASGFDYFCSSIAYFKDGVLTAGSIYRPTHNEFYYGEKGKGSFIHRSNQKIQLAMRNMDSREQFLTAEAWGNIIDEDAIKFASRLLPTYRGLRVFGAIALDFMNMAENVIGLIISERGPWIWDIAAANIILKEAGGEMYTWHGDVISLDVTQDQKKQFQLFACHPEKKEEVLKVMNH